MTDTQAIKKIFKYVKPHIFVYTISFLTYASQTFIFPLALSILMGAMMNAILYSNLSIATVGIINILYIIIPSSIIIGFAIYFYSLTAAKIERSLKKDLFNAFIKKDLERSSHTGEGIAAINTEANTAKNLYSNDLAPILMAAMAAIFGTITIIILDFRMAIGVILIAIFTFFIQIIFSKPLEKIGKELLEENAEAVKTAANILEGQAVLRTFNRQQKALIEFDPHNMKIKKINIKRAFIEMLQGAFTTVQGFLTIFLVFGLGSYFVVTGSLTLPVLIMIPPLADAIVNSLSGIGQSIANLKPSLVAAKRVLTIIDGVEAEKEIKNLTQPHIIEGYEINIENLNFSYKDSEENVLKNINLNIKENELVAFVGSSGSGKSTLLKVIIGLYEREALPITIGNTKFSNKIIKDWRSQFAYVDQSSKLFDISIEENLRLVKENASEAEIIEALKKAGLEGINIKAKSENLSGGQKQRIAIARALLRNSKIIVFDEATSALDSETEKEILQTIEELRTTHTILLITHNLKSTETADKIIILENGEISEKNIYND
ncbi:MAG: ABC transporter ATP-binding protein/permease [Defluviitaleaceae bacterium]|nr:ABC transporter ATP-binding protein/permease [Defluviitaleaceae bacterium]